VQKDQRAHGGEEDCEDAEKVVQGDGGGGGGHRVLGQGAPRVARHALGQLVGRGRQERAQHVVYDRQHQRHQQHHLRLGLEAHAHQHDAQQQADGEQAHQPDVVHLVAHQLDAAVLNGSHLLF